MKKRILVYYSSVKEGKLTVAEEFFLKKIEGYVEKIIIVSAKEKETQIPVSNEKTEYIVTEKAAGHNFNAYECALKTMDDQDKDTYDEVICIADGLMGPVISLEELFAVIDEKNVDFLGLNKQNPTPLNFLDYSGANLQDEYLPSYFMIFRKKLLKENKILEVLENSKTVEPFRDSWIDARELYVTRKLKEEGYSFDSCIDTENIAKMYYNPLLLTPVEMLAERKCPFFLRDSFTGDYDTVISNTSGQAGLELMNYLNKETDYNTDFIWDNILKCGHQQDINHNLHLNYILDEKSSDQEKAQQVLKEKKVALVMHLYFMDLLENSLHYAQSMPKEADVYITTDTEEKKMQVEKVFAKLDCHKVDVRKIENRGRDVSSLLVGVKDVINDYDYVCFVHDKKSAQVVPGSIGKDFGYQCLENTLCSKDYVNNVLITLYENSRLGMLSPIYPIHGSYFATNGNYDWGANYENTVDVYKKLKLSIPISKEKSPVAPLGTMFWFKTPALKRLYACNWKYEDFPPEPNGVDGTLLHAIERIYSFVTQEEGYYPAMLMNREFADIQITNLTDIVQGVNRSIQKYHPYGSYQQALYFIHYLGNKEIELEARVKEREQQLDESNRRYMDLLPQASLRYQIKRKLKQILHIKNK